MEYQIRVLAYAAIVVAFVVILQNVVARYRISSKYKLPPRIPGIPIFGNTFQMPILQQGQWAQEMAAKYGEM